MASFAFSLAAILALVPGALRLPSEGQGRPDSLFWLVFAVAFGGVGAHAVALHNGLWSSGFSATIWVSILASLSIFGLLAAVTTSAWRLMPLLFTYLSLLGIAAMLAETSASGIALTGGRWTANIWIILHIAFAVAAYAFATLAAVAALAVLVKERALKRKRPGRLTAVLPAVAEGERLQVRLMLAAAVVLAVDIITGMAAQVVLSGELMRFEHKTLFSLLAFAVISVLLVIHLWTGLRGQRAARLGLVAYLLLTLAYPGVKFVTDVLIG